MMTNKEYFTSDEVVVKFGEWIQAFFENRQGSLETRSNWRSMGLDELKDAKFATKYGISVSVELVDKDQDITIANLYQYWSNAKVNYAINSLVELFIRNNSRL